MLLDSSIKDKDLQFIINKFLPKFVFCSRANLKKLPKDYFNLEHTFQNYSLMKSKKENLYKINDQLMILISTSGSIGEPKFVKLSLNNIMVNTQSIISYLSLKSFDRAITTMPLSYSYGFSIITPHLYCGGSIVPNNFSLVILLVAITTSVSCQAGDLFFSYLKRKSFLKDTGNLLPCHGGVLDRVDGILLGVPIGFITLLVLN